MRDVAAGTGVGYGHTWIADRPTRLALVPLGYGDGVPRVAASKAEVLVHGRRRRIAGAISMDQLVVDVGDLPVRLGDEVTLFGAGDRGEPTIADWSAVVADHSARDHDRARRSTHALLRRCGMSRVRVAVIGGGENCEHDVSLASAAAVRSALDPSRRDIVGFTIGRDGVWTDAGGRSLTLPQAIEALQGCDVVFPAVHGPRGEDGSLAALLDFARVPFVGSGVRSGALAMDKWATKLVAEAVGVRTARGELIQRGDAEPAGLRMPVVVKPVAAGSSFGVTRVDHEADLAAALDQALQVDDRALVEPFVTGREVDIAVLKRADGSLLLSAPLEIAVDGLFDTERKYDGSADLQVPAHITGEELTELERQAVAVFEALGCDGVARIDFFLTDDGLVLNEVNTMPGMTAASQVPRMFAAVGLDYAELLDELIASAIR